MRDVMLVAVESQLRDFRDQMRSPRAWPTLARTLEWVRVFGELADELRAQFEPGNEIGGEG